MRNCFVPRCDAFCKDKMPKRKMFMPPKDPNLFDLWQQLLPKTKRPLKATDKICERHFRPDEIVTSWDHVINGAIHSVIRSKPCLKKNAIPSLNLKVEIVKLKPTSKPKNTESSIILDKEDNISIEIIEVNAVSEKPEDSDKPDDLDKPEVYEFTLLDSKNETSNLTEKTQVETEEEQSDKFESIYEDIFEVMLPSTLWGIHRDPERKFIVFSEFDKNSMLTKKLFYLDHKSNYNLIVNNTCVTAGYINRLSLDFIEKMLQDFSEEKL